MRFKEGDIVKFVHSNRGEEYIYLIIRETSDPGGWSSKGEAYFYDALELQGEEEGDTFGIVVADWNRKAWSLLA